MSTPPQLPPADWYPDPTGQHHFRYWDGRAWTDAAASNGITVSSPMVPLTQPVRSETAATAAASKQAKPRRGWFAKKEKAVERPLATGPRLAPYPLPGMWDRPSLDIEGEFSYPEEIHAVLGRSPRMDEEIVLERTPASLVPEPTNPHDPQAVRVQCSGLTVGYLAREDARELAPVLARLTASGLEAVTSARIWAVARRDENNPRKPRYFANVRVALREPHLLLPTNNPPRHPYTLLPWGSALQLSGEEQHQVTLGRYIASSGDGLALGTMHVVEAGSVRAPKEAIEVRIDGAPVGTLSVASSQHFIALAKHLVTQRVEAAVWLRLKGNRFSTQVTVQAAKTHDIPQSWFGAPQTLPALRS